MIRIYFTEFWGTRLQRDDFKDFDSIEDAENWLQSSDYSQIRKIVEIEERELDYYWDDDHIRISD